MSRREPENGSRVTLRDLFDILKDYPTRRELYLVVGGTMFLGQLAASAASNEPTRTEAIASRLIQIVFQ